MTNFERAIAIVLREECGPGPDATGLVDNPKDPGGLTKYGISQRAYPGLDIRALSREDAVAIYRRDYWAAVHGEDLPWPLCLFVFDHAINAGPRQAIRLLQGGVGVKVDGVWGPATAAQANQLHAPYCTDARLFEFCRSYNAARVRYYLGLATAPTFGVGWCGRVAAVALAAGFSAPAAG